MRGLPAASKRQKIQGQRNERSVRLFLLDGGTSLPPSPCLESVFFVVTSSLMVERQEVLYACQAFFLAFPRVRVYQAFSPSLPRCRRWRLPGYICNWCSAPRQKCPRPLRCDVTDAQGLTVDGAQISTEAWMTNMRMETDATSTTGEGQGTYLVQIRLSMAGPWMISVTMQATGFTPMSQTLLVQVQSMDALACPVKAIQWELMHSS